MKTKSSMRTALLYFFIANVLLVGVFIFQFLISLIR